jgi:phosphoribosylglycinamide formyltransferase-1
LSTTGLSSLITEPRKEPCVPDAVTGRGRLVVLASGTGTLFDALVAAARQREDVTVVALVCDRPDAGALEVAARHGVPATLVPLLDPDRRADWDVEMAQAIGSHRPDLVVSAGFMRLLGPAVLGRFANRVINTHPALLPAFPGTHAVRDALAYGVQVTGCTVHLVDSGVDTGPVIAQRVVEVSPDDDESSLHERIKEVERVLLPQVAFGMLSEGWTVTGRRVTIP